jgi:enediyne biosynthesis protein E3
MSRNDMIIQIEKIHESRKIRGVRPIPEVLRQRYAQIQKSFGVGYQSATVAHDFEAIVAALSEVDAELRGFAYEGVGTALAQKEISSSAYGSLINPFVTQWASAYRNYVHVGVGLMLARQKLSIMHYLEALGSEGDWLVIDGYGFQYGFTLTTYFTFLIKV